MKQQRIKRQALNRFWFEVDGKLSAVVASTLVIATEQIKKSYPQSTIVHVDAPNRNET